MATGLGESDLSEPEVELTLGLSIGGINRTASVPPPAATAGQSLRRSDSAGEQREMHALRRHEARRKLEEKQRRKGGLCRGGSAAAAALPTGFGFLSAEERAALEAQQRQIRARGRDGESRETDSISPRWPPCRKQGGVEIPNFPAVMPMRYRFPQVQYLPVVNGFGIPCMMPCWAPAISAAAAAAGNGSNKPDCNVYHLVAAAGNGSNKPDCNVYHPVAAAGNGSNKPDCNVYHPVTAAANMQSKGFCARKGIAAVVPARQSKDSASSSTSGISAQAGSKNSSSSNSDARSNSISNHIAKKSASIQATDEKLGSGTDNTLTLVPRKLEEANSVNKPISEETETKLRRPTPLPRMPCVSATGDGPHGKTITGVLYKYEKSEEVSILCVCHGSSFSPAEFVKHAGGIETAYPMRQIVVVPS